jgi:phospholipid/cholesterol/gamma-HCH transport system substrate-binding protein
MGSLRALLTSKPIRFGLAGVVLVAAVIVGVEVTKGKPTYPINVVYSSAPGLFTGAAVDVLGVQVGTVTGVENVGDKVHVTLAVDQGTRIPSSAFASLVSPQLLGSPDVDLNPGYTGGSFLASDATIPQDHTAVPVSTDELLKELQRTLNAINPHAVGNLVTNLATDLDGQGANLNKLIASAAGTVQLLATKGDDLGQLNGTLAQLTGTLDTDTSQIEQLVEQYDTVSTTVAQHSGQLNDAITQLAGASSGLVSLLVPNLQPLEADVGTVTTVGRTLDRNLSSVDAILQNGNNLFQGAARAYDPNYNWLDLNVAASPGVTGAYIAGLLRDRLAGICRRIVADHSSGLSAAVIATLSQCGNPSSGFFDPLLNDIPTILNSLSGGSGSDTAQSMLQQGLAQIANAEHGAQAAPATPSSPAPSGKAPASTTTTTTTPPPTTTTTTPCGLLGAVLGCSGSGSGSGSGSSGGSSSSGSGLGGLLSNQVTRQSSASTATLAVAKPTLTAPAASLLPALPQDQVHHSHTHRGLLSGWVHDVEGWF